MDPPKIVMDRETLQHMVVGKVNKENQAPINSLSFSNDGDHLITSTDDDCIYLFDMKTGLKSRSVNSKKYGVNHIRFASNASCAVHSSTKIDNTIRYLSLADNKYLRYFQGHTDRVTGLSMSPLDDMFLSVSRDKTIRLWDLRTYNCMGIMNVQSNAIAAFDPEGLIFAAGMNSEVLKLYDLRSFDKGPFLSFTLQKDVSDWVGMRFSPCGKMIMINTNGNSIILVDAFTGAIRCTLEGHENIDKVPLYGAFSPDSKFAFCGSSDKTIVAWDTSDGTIVKRYSTLHDETPHIVDANPKYFSIASANKKLLIWCPGESLNIKKGA